MSGSQGVTTTTTSVSCEQVNESGDDEMMKLFCVCIHIYVIQSRVVVVVVVSCDPPEDKRHRRSVW